jgi:anti-sigma B factor antagonist
VTASSFDPTPSTDLLRIDVHDSGPTVLVAATGEVDSTSSALLRQRLDDLLDGNLREFTVDLVGVTFLDSAGLSVLASAHRRAVRQGVRMRVLASSRAVIRPLEITGLWQLLGAERVEAAAPRQEEVAAS